jgi:hypothetical protein
MAASASGLLEVRVTATSKAVEEFERLDLALVRIAIRGARRDDGWMDYAPSAGSVNLADQIGGHTATVMRQEVPVGPYDAVRIDVGSAVGTPRDGRTPRLTVSVQPVRVRFEVRPGRTTSVVVDFAVMKLKGEPGQRLDYEIRIERAFVDPLTPTHSGFFGPAHRDSFHRGKPRHGPRHHLGARTVDGEGLFDLGVGELGANG